MADGYGGGGGLATLMAGLYLRGKQRSSNVEGQQGGGAWQGPFVASGGREKVLYPRKDTPGVIAALTAHFDSAYAACSSGQSLTLDVDQVKGLAVSLRDAIGLLAIYAMPRTLTEAREP